MRVMRSSTRNTIVENKKAAMGTGSLIIFITIVLVAGIAASVLVQTSTNLESQAVKTGTDTTDEVASGLAVYDIKGYAATSGNLDKMSINVRTRAGSAAIDLGETIIELSDTDYKILLNYSTDYYVPDGSGQDDVLSSSYFPPHATKFGILIFEDADDSCGQTTPVINSGDKVLIGIDVTKCFPDTAGINARTDIMGIVAPEVGSPGVIRFMTPPLFIDNVIDLQ